LGRGTATPLRLAGLCDQELIEAIACGWADRDASIGPGCGEELSHVEVHALPGYPQICL
jgi:hypothetical protein